MGKYIDEDESYFVSFDLCDTAEESLMFSKAIDAEVESFGQRSFNEQSSIISKTLEEDEDTFEGFCLFGGFDVIRTEPKHDYNIFSVWKQFKIYFQINTDIEKFNTALENTIKVKFLLS